MGYCPGNPINILNGDNIKHLITFSQIVSGKKVVYPVSDIDIIATYYITGSENKYIASKTGNVVVNCLSDITNQSIRVMLEDYTLSDGLLMCELKIKNKDADYPDSKNNFTLIINTNIQITSSKDSYQDNCQFSSFNVNNNIKTDIVVRKIEGDASGYNLRYDYVYIL